MGKTERDAAWKAAAEGRCIICDETKDVLLQGLCRKHYQRQRRFKMKLRREGATAEEIDELEEKMIEAGTLLPNQQGRTRAAEPEDAMDAVFAEYLATKHERTEADEQKLAEQLIDDSAELAPQKKKTPKRKNHKP